MTSKRFSSRALYGLGFLGLFILLFNIFCNEPPAPKKPRVLAVRPSEGFHKKDIPVIIHGQDLPEKFKAILINAEKKQIQLTNLRRIDDKKAEATIPSNADVGAYDLQIVPEGENPQPLTLGGAYEVLPSALTIYTISVGQGDATLLLSPSGKTMLIDAGREEHARVITPFLQRIGVKHLDHIIATHYDADHVGGLENVINGPDGQSETEDDLAPKTAIWDPGGWSKNSSYARARNRFKTIHKKLDGSSKESFPTIDLGGDVKVKVMVTNGVYQDATGKLHKINCKTDSNCRSVGTLITIGKFRFWTAGDLTGGGNGTPDVESSLAKVIGSVDVYRAHHHGSKTSSNKAFAQALAPQVVIVSSGRDNSYCHPHPSILDLFAKQPGTWMLVTSAGITPAKTKCSPTKNKMSAFGSRQVLGAGTIRISAQADNFTIKVTNKPPLKTWKVRGN